MSKGFIVVITAPSGAGKTTICHRVEQNMEKVIYSISATTREKRKNEIDGKDYYFLKEREFKNRIEKNDFAEWAFVHGKFYGTPKDNIQTMIKEGKILIMDIDVQGAMNIQRSFPDSSILIFVLPPKLLYLKERLLKREQDNIETIELRLLNAREEIMSIDKFDYLVINNNLDDAVENVIRIIETEKFKVKRNFKKISKLKEDIDG